MVIGWEFLVRKDLFHSIPMEGSLYSVLLVSWQQKWKLPVKLFWQSVSGGTNCVTPAVQGGGKLWDHSKQKDGSSWVPYWEKICLVVRAALHAYTYSIHVSSTQTEHMCNKHMKDTIVIFWQIFELRNLELSWDSLLDGGFFLSILKTQTALHCTSSGAWFYDGFFFKKNPLYVGTKTNLNVLSARQIFPV